MVQFSVNVKFFTGQGIYQTGIYCGKIWWNYDTKPYRRTELYDDIFLEDGLTTWSLGDDRSTPRHAFRGGLESVTVNSRFPVEGRAHCCVLNIHNAQLSTTRISASKHTADRVTTFATAYELHLPWNESNVERTIGKTFTSVFRNTISQGNTESDNKTALSRFGLRLGFIIIWSNVDGRLVAPGFRRLSDNKLTLVGTWTFLIPYCSCSL